MISQIYGKIIEKNAPSLILVVNGIGYELICPISTFYKLPDIGSNIKLFTHLQIKEDSHTLYGFFNKETKLLFLNLIKVNGVGAKVAISILSALSNEQLLSSVSNGDTNYLQQTPGIGKKTAQRIIIELKDNFAKIQLPIGSTVKNSSYTEKDNNIVNQAIAALKNLGFKEKDSEKMVDKVKNEASTIEELIKLSLKKY